MRKVERSKIEIKDIKFFENSRLRNKEDVADLMEDIEQRGLLHPIGVRKSDNALIYGNRRIRAFKNLGYKKIDADFYEDVNDDNLLITNLAENLKDKSIGSIEIGRICKILLDKGMTRSEISIQLKIAISRVSSAINAYEVTVGTPFEKLVIHGKFTKHLKGIPESILWDIQNNLSRARKGKMFNKEEWNVLLKALEERKIIKGNIPVLRKIFMSMPEISVKKAIEMLNKCKVLHIYFQCDEKELWREMNQHKFSSETQFIKSIVRNYNEKLLF